MGKKPLLMGEERRQRGKGMEAEKNDDGGKHRAK